MAKKDHSIPKSIRKRISRKANRCSKCNYVWTTLITENPEICPMCKEKIRGK